MTGWRCGFVAGNELLVRAYGDVKDNTDSGQFLAIQHAAAHGFDHPDITAKIAARYSRRMTALAEALAEAGFQARKPQRLVLPLCQGAKGGGDKRGRAEGISQRLKRSRSGLSPRS